MYTRVRNYMNFSEKNFEKNYKNCYFLDSNYKPHLLRDFTTADSLLTMYLDENYRDGHSEGKNYGQ